jgi:hypothetical protein
MYILIFKFFKNLILVPIFFFTYKFSIESYFGHCILLSYTIQSSNDFSKSSLNLEKNS